MLSIARLLGFCKSNKVAEVGVARTSRVHAKDSYDLAKGINKVTDAPRYTRVNGVSPTVIVPFEGSFDDK